ncbi:hypothetical protein ANN_04667 [Periplaneta americana]|uniref:Uncharacterized protein n=1 Tax=Periplaneta americana TaxID=6978 RepID=A0ABQ8TAV5_PERAM|nr:hypothetical protein ANN_04667 [Periplaneta americana]
MNPVPLKPPKAKDLRDLLQFSDEDGQSWLNSMLNKARTSSHNGEDDSSNNSDDASANAQLSSGQFYGDKHYVKQSDFDGCTLSNSCQDLKKRYTSSHLYPLRIFQNRPVAHGPYNSAEKADTAIVELFFNIFSIGTETFLIWDRQREEQTQSNAGSDLRRLTSTTQKLIPCRGQPIGGGPPAWGFGEGLTTHHRKKQLVTKPKNKLRNSWEARGEKTFEEAET